MLVPFGMRNCFGLSKSSVRNHPPIFTAALLVLYSSIASVRGGSVWVKISLMRIGVRTATGGGSVSPGDPFSWVLGRQLLLLSHVFQGAFSSTITSEGPAPSVIGYQELL